MQSSSQNNEIRGRIISALKAFGFFVFSREEYPHISQFLKTLSLWNLFKVKPLSSSRSYFLLEPDVTHYISGCKDSCAKEGIIDVKCYLACRERKSHELLNEILRRLEGGDGG